VVAAATRAAVTPEEFFLLLRGAIRQFLVGAALDAQFAIGITEKLLGFVVAIFDVGSLIILFYGSP
jgi:hypothetical protein